MLNSIIEVTIKITPRIPLGNWDQLILGNEIRNCVSIGLSSGFIEPLESTSIHLIQSGIMELIKNFPLEGINPINRQRYNDQVVFEIEHIRDFIVMHYHVTNRRDTEFWRHCASMSVPDSLQMKIDAYRDTGRLHLDDGEMFGDSWSQVFIGQGLLPQAWHPFANGIKESELQTYLGNIRNRVSQQVGLLDNHAPYVNAYCEQAPIRQQKSA